MAGAPNVRESGWKEALNSLLDGLSQGLESALSQSRIDHSSLISAYEEASSELVRIKEKMDASRVIHAQAYALGRFLLSIQFKNDRVFADSAYLLRTLSLSLFDVFLKQKPRDCREQMNCPVL
jgi:hypothetical protein